MKCTIQVVITTDEGQTETREIACLERQDLTRGASLTADPHARVEWGLGSDLPGVVSGVPCCSPAHGGVTPQNQTLSWLPEVLSLETHVICNLYCGSKK
jgi:hypothetical protein